MKTHFGTSTSLLRFRPIAIVLACSAITSNAFAQILAIDPFTGSLSESWESFPSGPLTNSSPTRIMQGHAVIPGGSYFVYEPSAGIHWQWGEINAAVAGGTKGLGQAGGLDIEFDTPVSSFGGYWGVLPGENPNEGGEPNLIQFAFLDTALSVIGTASVSPTNQQGTLEWHGWRSPRPIQRVIISGLFLAVDSLRARTFEEGPVVRPITYTLAPGSTITAWEGEQPVGPAEALTGSFEWTQIVAQESVVGYDTTQLDWRSPSYKLQIGSNHVFLGSAVFISAGGVSGGIANFGTVVETPSLPGASLQFVPGDSDGAYTGPADYPRTLEYSYLPLYPLGGGITIAQIHLVAVAVDGDGDGVPDSQDQCPDTPLLGEVVDAQGCSIAQLAPCAGPISGGDWSSHVEYVAAVRKVAGRFRRAGFITAPEWKAIVRAAVESDCGSR